MEGSKHFRPVILSLMALVIFISGIKFALLWYNKGYMFFLALGIGLGVSSCVMIWTSWVNPKLEESNRLALSILFFSALGTVVCYVGLIVVFLLFPDSNLLHRGYAAIFGPLLMISLPTLIVVSFWIIVTSLWRFIKVSNKDTI